MTPVLPLVALLLQQPLAAEARAADGLDAFAWIFMLASMAAVTTLTVWCYSRILTTKEHFDPDGTGPDHSPRRGRIEGGD